MIRFILSALVIANVGFCSPDCGDREPIESSFPAGVSENVPYNDNQSVTFKHNGGQKINFDINRFSSREEGSQCDACCTQVIYDSDETLLIPNYPTFEMEVRLQSYDSINFSYFLKVGDSNFNLRMEEDRLLIDSLEVAGEFYFNVYKIKNLDHRSEQSVYPDSVYYNFSEGFLKVIMSNNEFYEIQ